jgi:hypothetical protein
MCATGLRKRDLECKKFNAVEEMNLNDLVADLKMKPPSDFRDLLKQYGCFDRVVKELWKWYDPPKEK